MRKREKSLNFNPPRAMRSSNGDNDTWSNWEPYSTSKSFALSLGEGMKTVYVQYSDQAGLISLTYQAMVKLDTTEPRANAGADRTLDEDVSVARASRGYSSFTKDTIS